MSRKKIILLSVLGTLLALIAAGSVFVGFTIAKAPSLDLTDVVPDGYLTSVLDDEGNTIDTLAGVEANRVYVTLDQVPDDLKHAFIAIEDERFYQHKGIDLIGVSRALVKGITTFRFSQGASTITQQLIKNNVLTSWTEEQTFLDKVERKIQEQYLALRLERIRSKEWVLENYLNTINLGGGTWGVQAASMRYFGKSVSELTLSESAVLAAIAKSPAGFDPLNHPEANKERMTAVLDNMLAQEYIPQEAYDAALADDVYERIAQTHTDRKAHALSWFEDALLNSVTEDLMTQHGYTEDEAWDAVYRGGLTIKSTQNTDLQRICEEEVNNDALYSGDQQVSVVITNGSNGSVMAIVGGRGAKDSSLVYNRAVESTRQAGSTIKIIGEYAAALDSGRITLGTVLDDEPYAYSDGTPIQNAGNYMGKTTLRGAIAWSSNIIALKVYQDVGGEAVLAGLKKFGISTLDQKDVVEPLAIGGTYHGVTNLEMTAAYNTLCAGGTYTRPYFYTEVVDHDGKVLLSREPESSRAVKAETAFLLTRAMMSVFDYGTGVTAAFEGLPIAGKTGTTNDNKDVWTIGYCPYFTCGVWGGFDDNSAQSDTDYVKILWKNIMKRGTSDYIYREFEVPEDITTATICTKCGNLAVEGLCDSTVQGDMTRTEYFVSGTAPTKKCKCHTEVRVCKDSGMKAGPYCPYESVETRVYLKEATPGTSDEKYLAPSFGSETCTEHTSLLEKMFGGDDDRSGFWGDDKETEESDEGKTPGNENGSRDDSREPDPYNTDPYGGVWDFFFGP